MKFRTIHFSVLLVLAGASEIRGQDTKEKPWPPQAYPEVRYEVTWSRDPFNLKTVPVEKVVASFAANLAIAGVSVVGDEKAVILVDRTTRKFQRVTSKPNAAGISLISVSADADITKVVAEIAKDGEKAEVRYEIVVRRTANRPKAGGENAGKAKPSDGRGESGEGNGR